MSREELRAEEARPGLRPGRVYQPGASDSVLAHLAGRSGPEG